MPLEAVDAVVAGFEETGSGGEAGDYGGHSEHHAGIVKEGEGDREKEWHLLTRVDHDGVAAFQVEEDFILEMWARQPSSCLVASF